MSNIEWDKSDQESPEAIAEALASVREKGTQLRKRRHTRKTIATSSAALVLVVALLSGVLLRGTSDQTQAELAASVLAQSNAALGQLHGLSYDTTESSTFAGGPSYQSTGSGRVDERGNTWTSRNTTLLSAPNPGEPLEQRSETRYDSETNTIETCETVTGCTETANANPLTSFTTTDFNRLSLFASEINHATNLEVTKSSVDGRKVWHLTGRLDPYDETVDIDYKTKLVTAYSLQQGDQVLKFAINNFVTNPKFGPNDFDVVSAAGKDVEQGDENYSPVDGNIVNGLSYQQLSLASLPKGFKLAQTLYSPDSLQINTSSVRQQVVQTYRQGLASFVFYSAGVDGSSFAFNPLSLGRSYATKESITLTKGFLANSKIARIDEVLPDQLEALSATSLWAVQGDVVVAIAGDLSPEEIVSLANSVTGSSSKASSGSTSSTTLVDSQPVAVTGAPLPAEYSGLGGASDINVAVGAQAPDVVGKSFSGDTVAITNDGKPKVLIISAYWSPHAQSSFPGLVDWLKTNTGAMNDVSVYAVSTNASGGQAYDSPYKTASSFFKSIGWPTAVLADDAAGDAGTAYGVGAYPYFVVLDAHNKVVTRSSGEVTGDELAKMIQQAQSS